MALKRKFELEVDDVVPTNAKQLKLVPFPNYEPDNDVAMSDAEPMFAEAHHTRLSSTASSLSTSSNVSDSSLTDSPPYPTFDLYPSSPTDQYPYTPAQSPSSINVGLLQPTSTLVHHGSNCYQIPKLRVACAAGPNGQRTMWSFCEQCGAISMVESD